MQYVKVTAINSLYFNTKNFISARECNKNLVFFQIQSATYLYKFALYI